MAQIDSARKRASQFSQALGNLVKQLLAFTLLFPSIAFGFNYEAYVDESMANLLDRAREVVDSHEHTEGVELIFPVKKLHLYEVLAKQPFKCDTDFLFSFLKILGFDSREQLPPINSCIEIKAESGEKVIFFVQDKVAAFIPKEVQLGQKIHLYAIWIYVSDENKLPYLLLNEFKTN